MSRSALVALLLGLLVPVLGIVPAASATETPPPPTTSPPTATTLALSGPAEYADRSTPLLLTLRDAEGSPVAEAAVSVQRRAGEAWQPVADAVTGADGTVVVPATMHRDPAQNVFRATYAGDAAHAPTASEPTSVPLRRRRTTARLRGPDEVVDGRRVTLRVRWRTRSGLPVEGELRLRRRVGDRWRGVSTLTTGPDGRATVRLRPRTDTRWRVRGRRLDWVAGDTSRTHRIDNLPPGSPVRLPASAPRPRIQLPAQPRATGRGAHAVVTAIPDPVWRQMTGVTWHRGCPVGRADLRLLRVNYWDYAGYRRRGELVVHADAAGQVAAALAEMHRRRLPIRSMYRVDRFGWSGKLRGGDDYRSMAAGNTSAFNCRDVVGRPGVRSPHSWGRAVDVNPWENPYRTGSSWLPNGWWVGRSHPRVAWRSRSHAVVSLMARHGLRWSYGVRDAHHFDAR